MRGPFRIGSVGYGVSYEVNMKGGNWMGDGAGKTIILKNEKHLEIQT